MVPRFVCRSARGIGVDRAHSVILRFKAVRSVCWSFGSLWIRRGTGGKLGPNFEPKLSETTPNTVTRDAPVSACHLEKCPICNASPSPPMVLDAICSPVLQNRGLQVGVVSFLRG